MEVVNQYYEANRVTLKQCCEKSFEIKGILFLENYKPVKYRFIVRRAGLLWSQQDFEWLWSVPLSSASLY